MSLFFGWFLFVCFVLGSFLNPQPASAVHEWQLGLQSTPDQPMVVQVDVDGGSYVFDSRATTLREALAQIQFVSRRRDVLYIDGEPASLDTPLPYRLPEENGMPVTLIEEGTEMLAQPSEWVLTRQPTLTIMVQRAVPVYVSVDGLTHRVFTSAENIGQVIKNAGVQMEPEDAIHPSIQTPVKAGLHIYVSHALDISIQADGELIAYRTLADTVEEALGESGVRLTGKDLVVPGLATSLQDEMRIRVARVWEDTMLEEEWLDYDIVLRADPEMEIDQIKLVQSGKNGLRRSQWRLRYENGELASKTMEKEWLEVVPEDEITAYGTNIVIRTLDTPSGPIEYWRTMRVYATWYDARHGGKPRSDPYYGYTRLGLLAEKGIVAVDPTVIPFYTRMYVPGYGVGMAADTGGGIKGRWIDLAFSEGEQHNWGSGWVDIYILTPVPSADQIRWILPEYPG